MRTHTFLGTEVRQGLGDIYVSHVWNCDCPSCQSMDFMLSEIAES